MFMFPRCLFSRTVMEKPKWVCCLYDDTADPTPKVVVFLLVFSKVFNVQKCFIFPKVFVLENFLFSKLQIVSSGVCSGKRWRFSGSVFFFFFLKGVHFQECVVKVVIMLREQDMRALNRVGSLFLGWFCVFQKCFFIYLKHDQGV